MGSPFAPLIQRGQRIKGRVVEIQVGNELLVNFQGRLVRVLNTTERTFRVDDVLNLQVVSLKPLELKIYERSETFDRMI